MKGCSKLKLFKKKTRKIWLYEKYCIYTKKISVDFEFKSKFFFKKGTKSDIPFVVKQFDKHFGSNPEEMLNNRLNSGEIMLLGFPKSSSKSIIFISWLSESEPFFIEIKKNMKIQNAIYSFRTLVPHEYRQKGAGKEGIAYAEKTAYDEGYFEVWGMVREDNIASQRMLKSRGWKTNGKLVRKVFMNKQYIRVFPSIP